MNLKLGDFLLPCYIKHWIIYIMLDCILDYIHWIHWIICICCISHYMNIIRLEAPFCSQPKLLPQSSTGVPPAGVTLLCNRWSPPHSLTANLSNFGKELFIIYKELLSKLRKTPLKMDFKCQCYVQSLLFWRSVLQKYVTI